jgi:hypothetical protein
MERPRNPSCGWSLFIAATLAMSSNTHAQSLASNLATQESNSVSGRVASPTAAVPGIAKPSQRSMAGGLISIELAPAATLAPHALRELPNPIIRVAAPQPRPAAARSLIDAHSVACQAALQWLPAKQLRQQAQAVQELYCESETCARQAANAIAKFLCMQANHQQDLAAANALRAYYGHAHRAI